MRITLDLDEADLDILIAGLNAIIYDPIYGYWREKELRDQFQQLLDELQHDEADEASND